MTGAIIAIIIIAVIALIIICASVKIVRQASSVVVERLGKYHKTLETGLRLVLPFIDRCSAPISLKEIVADFKPQPVITKDNVTMQIDTVVYFQVTDPKLYTYGVDNPVRAIENLTATTLRNIVGELELDETLTSRDTVNSKMRVILDEATDPWGIKINRVELKNILPPKDIQDAMEKQMRAERERREQILKAEGEKVAVVLDPPRKGCDRLVLEALLSALPDKIVYVSCSPQTLARDLGILLNTLVYDGNELKRNQTPNPCYEITKIQPYDMFPQTKHVETLVCLTRKD